MPFDPNRSPNVVEGLSDEELSEKKIMFFGRDLTQIPCFKESFLYGVLGGIGCGLFTFMATSRVGKATNVAVFSFSGIVLVYWFNCRMKWSRSKFAIKQTQIALKEYDDIRGTERDPNRKVETQD